MRNGSSIAIAVRGTIVLALMSWQVATINRSHAAEVHPKPEAVVDVACSGSEWGCFPRSGSADGSKVLVTRHMGNKVLNTHLFLIDLKALTTTDLTPTTSDTFSIHAAIFGPRDERVYYVGTSLDISKGLQDWKTELISVALDGKTRVVEADFGRGYYVSSMAWSPDAKRLAFVRAQDGNVGASANWSYTVTVLENGKLRDVATGCESEIPNPGGLGRIQGVSWLSPADLLFNVTSGSQKNRLMKVNVEGGVAQAAIFRELEGSRHYAFVSPDGRWLVYMHEGKVVIQPVEGGGEFPICTGAINENGFPWFGRAAELRLLAFRTLEVEPPRRLDVLQPFIVSINW